MSTRPVSLRRDRRPPQVRLATRNVRELFGVDDLITLGGIFLATTFLLNFLGDWVESRPAPGVEMTGEERPGEAVEVLVRY